MTSSHNTRRRQRARAARQALRLCEAEVFTLTWGDVSLRQRAVHVRSRQPRMSTARAPHERLRLGRTLVYRLISSGELESVTVGRLRRVPAECLAEYVAALRRARRQGAAGGSSAA